MNNSPKAKFGLEFGAILIALKYGLPSAIGIFEPVSRIEGKNAEEQFHQYDYLYFDKGL